MNYCCLSLALTLYHHGATLCPLFQTRWYSIRDTVPPAYWTFLSSSVKKSSGIAKRLVRLSEIFLFDFKDWPGFQKTARMMIVDYILRQVGLKAKD